MLNHEMDAVVLVKGWKKGANWSFPRGKINKDEPDLECAIREVYEETGFDIEEAGLAAKDDNVKFIEITMREQHMRLYVFRDVPMDTYFEPKTRKEISKVQWYKLSDLPTQKKGKNHQEARGEDLANNANKFYMVAPFLNALKKWIMQQKKLDKQKDTPSIKSTGPSVSLGSDEPRTAPLANGTTPTITINEMERLLAGLRQSSQTSGMPVVPELSDPILSSAQQATGPEPPVNLNRHASEASIPPTRAPSMLMTANVDRRKSDALFALLKGKNITDQISLPHTPMEQVVDHPVMPPSPKHHHPPTHRKRGPSLPLPTSHPVVQAGPAIGQLKQSDQPRANLHPKHPPSGFTSQQVFTPQSDTPYAQRKRLVQASGHSSAQPYRNVPAPYQRPGDRTVAQASQQAGMPSLIPAANKLPPPKLTSHSSALLNLFTSGQPVKGPSGAALSKSVAAQAMASMPQRKPSYEERGVVSSMDDISSLPEPEMQPKPRPATQNVPKLTQTAKVEARSGQAESHDPNKNPEHTMPQGQDDSYANDLSIQAAMAALHPTPSAASIKNDKDAATPWTVHQTALLDLFRKPSISQVEATKEQKPSLDLPPTPFELSALPSPGHVREPSRVKEPARVEPIGDLSHILPMSKTHTKRTRAVLAPRKSPVSATVDGPLNVPQFDMLNKKLSKHPRISQNGTLEATRKSPVQILSRSTQHQTSSMPGTPNGLTKNEEVNSAPSNTMVSTPVVPVLATSTPQYQAQIHHRPPHLKPSQHDSILSPIEPLPSPKHALGRGKQTQDQKQILLSLFTSPSPSPALVATPVDQEALASPQAIQSKERVLYENARKPADGAPPAVGLERSRMGRLASIATDVSTKPIAGQQTPRATTTPKDRSFLMGYLEGVVRGEKR